MKLRSIHQRFAFCFVFGARIIQDYYANNYDLSFCPKITATLADFHGHDPHTRNVQSMFKCNILKPQTFTFKAVFMFSIFSLCIKYVTKSKVS